MSAGRTAPATASGAPATPVPPRAATPMTDRREDGRRLGESLVADVTLTEMMAQRRLGETIRDVERRLLVLGAGGASSAAPGDQDLTLT